jgi:hypothetical protein
MGELLYPLTSRQNGVLRHRAARTKSKSAKQSPRRGSMSWLHFAKNPSLKHKKQHTAFLVSGQSCLITSAISPLSQFSPIKSPR